MNAPSKMDRLYAAELASVNAAADLLDVAAGNPHLAEPFRSILNTALAVREEPAPDEPNGMFRDHSCWKCQDGKKACVRGAPHRCEFPHARND